MSTLDTRIAQEVGDMVDHAFASSDFWWRNYISWLERGRPSMLPEDMEEELRETEHMPPAELLITHLAPGVQRESEPVAPSIPIIGTIDSETGVITHHAPLPEPPAPLTAENYAAGRMPFVAWLVGALGIGVAVAIAAVMVLAERVRRRA